MPTALASICPSRKRIRHLAAQGPRQAGHVGRLGGREPREVEREQVAEHRARLALRPQVHRDRDQEGHVGKPALFEERAMALPTRARRQHMSRASRVSPTRPSRGTNAPRQKRACPNVATPVPGDTGGTGVSARM